MKRIIIPILAIFSLISYQVKAQFTGGCDNALSSDIYRSCTPSECGPNAGTFMTNSVVANYNGNLFPCATSSVAYNNTVKFNGVASNITGEYRITITLEPAQYIENLILPAVPAYFTGANTSATLLIPSDCPSAGLSFPGYAKTIYTGNDIVVTLLSTKTGTLPTTQFSLPVSFNLTIGAPQNIGVGQQLYSGITGRTSLPPTQVCQTRTTGIAAPLRCSSDPNEKIAYPSGCNENHIISRNDTLTYFLHFQNVGTAPAIRVALLDTIDSDLDINTLQVFGGSHPFEYQVLPGNIIQFVFDPILLSDSTSDEPGSHGYVSFTIAPRQDVADRAVIRNQTFIYFDNNEAVPTNVVWHTIGDSAPPVISILNKADQFCSSTPHYLHASPARSYLWNTGDTTQSILITSPGTYHVSGTFDYSCNMSTDSALVVSEDVNVDIASKVRTYCPGQSYTFEASPANSYLWSTGETTSSITVNQPGYYYLQASLDCGIAYDTAYLIADPLESCYSVFASTAIAYLPGTKKNGSALPSNHTKVRNALGRSDDLDAIAEDKWLQKAAVSLGFDRPSTFIEEGVLVVAFDDAIVNQFTVWSLYNATTPASANVYVSNSILGPWTKLGVATNQHPYSGKYSASTFALQGPYASVRYVKVSNISGNNALTEGFNVESVSAAALAGNDDETCSSDVMIYPNPFYDNVTVDLAPSIKVDIKITDSFGQVIIYKKNVNGTTSIAMDPGLKKGLYFLHVIRNNSVEIKILVKQ